MILLNKTADKLGKMPIKGYINVSTVGGESMLPIVPLCDVQVDQRHKRAIGAICDGEFANYDIILQNSMF